MGLRALLALCATPLVAGFGGLTYLRSIEDIEELHAPTVDTEGVKIEGVYDGLLHTQLSPLNAKDAEGNTIGTVYEFKHVEAGPVTTINLYEGHFPTPPPPSPASPPSPPPPSPPPYPPATPPAPPPSAPSPPPPPPSPPSAPLSFCYWRCYSTDSKGRRNVNTYVPTGTSGLPFARALTPLQVSPQATEGACTAEEDVYYCGGDACDICDYAF